MKKFYLICSVLFAVIAMYYVGLTVVNNHSEDFWRAFIGMLVSAACYMASDYDKDKPKDY